MSADPLALPRSELLALLDAVKDHPDDDTPRLVLADWLDEQDNPLDAERAKFIREHIAAVRGTPAQFLPTEAELDANRYARRGLVQSDEERAAAERLAELLGRWLGRVQATAYGASFHRGLPILIVPPTWFLRAEVTPLLVTEAFAFVQFVRLAVASAADMESMVAAAEFRHVPGMSFGPLAPLVVHSAQKILGSPHLTGLRQIDFYRVNPGAGGIQALAANPALARLRKLILIHNKLVDKAVIALAESPHLTNLTSLSLMSNATGDVGAEALAASGTLANLRELDLRDNPRLTERGKQLLRDKFGDRVRLS